MAVYASDEQLYSSFQTLFARIESYDPKAADALLKSSLAIRFSCTNPIAAITIDARKAPVNVQYGPGGPKPTVNVGLTADTLHCLLLGSLGLAKAIGSDLVELDGPVWKTLKLADLFHHAQRFYPDVLTEYGLATACPDLSG